MKLTEVILNSLQISGNKTGSGLLIESSDLPEYVDNKATGKIIGRRETIVFRLFYFLFTLYLIELRIKIFKDFYLKVIGILNGFFILIKSISSRIRTI